VHATLADRQHRLALSRQLATHSRATSATDRATSERLAAAALHLAPTDEAKAAAGALLADHHSVFPQTASVTAVAFSPDSKALAVASDDSTVRLWDPATGQPVGEPLRGHYGPVTAVAFSPDGRLLASASQDETVRLWDPATSQPAGEPLRGHAESVNTVAFSPDGTQELRPGRPATTGCPAHAVAAQDGPHRRRGHRHAQLAALPGDADIAHRSLSRASRSTSPTTSGSSLAGGRWLDTSSAGGSAHGATEAASTASPTRSATDRAEAASPTWPGPPGRLACTGPDYLPVQHGELMPQHRDLHILRIGT
jgi:hypothetical protein